MGRPAANSDDPLTLALAPPDDETQEQRTARVEQEARAKQISDEIDQQLRAERAALKKSRRIKVLLVGQSESGKSTTLKNFQLAFAPRAWAAERNAWKIVIQHNIIRSIISIVDGISKEPPVSSTLQDNEINSIVESDDDQVIGNDTFELTERHKQIIAQLEPLRSVKWKLEQTLGAAASEEDDELFFRTPSGSAGNVPSTRRPQEFFVRSNGWKNAFQKFSQRLSISHSGEHKPTGDKTFEVLDHCKQAIKALWEDKVIHNIIRERKIRLQDSAEFFLDEIDRVVSSRYTPSDDDIIRARLRTISVQEYQITLENGPEIGKEWTIYDVGGSLSMRQSWIPYFEGVDAIIFLAPMSCFNETLAEDRTVNRLEDSLRLWRHVCSNKLLAKTELILFLNKYDILDKKLRSGIKFSEFVRSYGNGRNEAGEVADFLRNQFSTLFKKNGPTPSRGLHIFFTSVVNTKATAKTLSAVQDGILRSNLSDLHLI